MTKLKIKKLRTKKNVKSQRLNLTIPEDTNEIFYDDPGYLAYGPPPEYTWTRQSPWISILSHFDQNCLIIIIPVDSKNNKNLPPIVIIKKTYKKLDVGFKPSPNCTTFDEYDHLIFWQNKILTKLPSSVTSQYDPKLISELYANITPPKEPFKKDSDWFKDLSFKSYKKPLDGILQIPVKIFRDKNVKLSGRLFGEAKKYLSWLNLTPEKRSKKENKNLINFALDAIISALKTKKGAINPKYLPMDDIDIALGNIMRNSNDIPDDSEETPYNRRSLNRISKNLLEGIKYCSPRPLTDSDCIRIIKMSSPKNIKKMYWNFQSYCYNRKTPPPLRITSK